MKKLLKPLFLVTSLSICATGAFANVDLTLTGVNAGYVMGGVYTSPYSVTVTNNGVSTPMLLICDDFLFNIPTIPYSWSAIPTTLADLQAGTNPTGTPKFVPADVTKYATASVLAAELMALPSYFSETAGELSYAIWGVFDSTLLTNNPASGEGHLTAPELSAAQSFLAAAQTVVANVTTNGVVDLSKLPTLTIYTPDPNSPPYKGSQEFLVAGVMPAFEAPYPVILALDLLAGLGLIVAFRKRLTNILN